MNEPQDQTVRYKLCAACDARFERCAGGCWKIRALRIDTSRFRARPAKARPQVAIVLHFTIGQVLAVGE